jgi:hypothetical protein
MAAMEKPKAKAWRGVFGVQDDEDLSFYFETHQEAVPGAGRAVTNEWAENRS